MARQGGCGIPCLAGNPTWAWWGPCAPNGGTASRKVREVPHGLTGLDPVRLPATRRAFLAGLGTTDAWGTPTDARGGLPALCVPCTHTHTHTHTHTKELNSACGLGRVSYYGALPFLAPSCECNRKTSNTGTSQLALLTSSCRGCARAGLPPNAQIPLVPPMFVGATQQGRLKLG